MRAVVETGIESLGAIPQDWEISKFRYVFRESKEVNGATPVGEMLSVSGPRGVVPKVYAEESLKRDADQLETYRVVRRGQLAVNTMWLNHGGLGVSELEGHVSPAYRTYWINHKVLQQYAHHLLRSQSYISGYTSYLTGVRPNSLQMSRDNLMNFPVLIPPLEEQKAIVEYLEAELPQIDLLISKKEQLIEKLLERRQALITQTVTKGLDPSVPMKDSGVEWIGNSPIEWPVRRLSTLANLQTGATPEGAYFSDAEGFPWLRPDDLDKVRGVVQATRFIPADTAKGMVTAPAGSSLMSGIGNVGDVAFLRAEASHNQQLTSVKARGENDRYLYFSLVAAKQEIQRLAVGNVVQILNNARLGSLQVPVPPVEIQKAIAEFLDSNCERIDTLIERSRAAVGCLQERRQALITQVVTGKLDVRGFDGGNS